MQYRSVGSLSSCTIFMGKKRMRQGQRPSFDRCPLIATCLLFLSAPEVLNFEMTNWGADMWSVGVLLYIL